MHLRKTLICAVAGLGLFMAVPTSGHAQVKVLSAAPPNVEYQYQLYYPRFFWTWAGPGLSLGGSLPSKGREGISSFYGRPMPAPFGAGVYVNPFAYGTMLPGPGLAYGLASNSTPSTNPAQGVGRSARQVAGVDAMDPATPIVPSSMSSLTTVPTTSTAPASAATQSAAPTTTPNPLALKQSEEMEALGDVHFRQQHWMQAWVNYRNAAIMADNRADLHLRLGFTCLALKQYPEAAQSFKKAFALDPSIGKTVDTLDSVYGLQNPEMSREVTNGVAGWTKENISDQDRLFLLGVVLRYKNDARSDQIIKAAMSLPGPKEHLVAFSNSPIPPANSNTLPTPTSIAATSIDAAQLPPLHEQPLALQPSRR